MLFYKYIRKLLREIGKVEIKYKKIYKSAKKVRRLTPKKLITCIDNNFEIFKNKDIKWFLLIYENGFAIDITKMIEQSDINTINNIWKHWYTLHILAMISIDSKFKSILEKKELYKNEDIYANVIHTYNVLEQDKSYNDEISSFITNNAGNMPKIPEGISSLAMEIAKDLHNSPDIKNLAHNLQGNPGNIMNMLNNMDENTTNSVQSLFATVLQKVNAKIENNEIDPNELSQQAEGILQTMNIDSLLKKK